MSFLPLLIWFCSAYSLDKVSGAGLFIFTWRRGLSVRDDIQLVLFGISG